MKAVFLDFGTVSHGDLDTTQLERVLPGITLYPTSSEAEVDERIAGTDIYCRSHDRADRPRGDERRRDAGVAAIAGSARSAPASDRRDAERVRADGARPAERRRRARRW